MSAALVTIAYQNATSRAISDYPITYGFPLPDGALREAEHLAVALPGGQRRRVQAQVLERWPSGAARWVLIDTAIPVAANERGELQVVVDEMAAPPPPMHIFDTPEGLTVTTPQLRVEFSRREFAVFTSYQVAGRELMLPGSDLIVEAPKGKRFYASLCQDVTWRVLLGGFWRTVIECRGRHTAEDGATLLDFRLRYTFRPTEPGVQVSYLFGNREQPELGVHLAAITMELPLALGKRTVKTIRQCNSGLEWFPRLNQIPENVELVAAKSTSEAAKASYGNVADGKVILRDIESLRENYGAYPHYLRPGNVRADLGGGLGASYPYVGVQGDGAAVVAWCFEMSQNFPKGLRADRHQLRFDLWPAWAGNLRLNRGMSKEHDLYLAARVGTWEPLAMEAVYLDHEVQGVGVLGMGSPPVTLTVDAEHVRTAQVLDLHRWLPYDEVHNAAVEAKMGTLAPGRSVGNLGMLDYGDAVGADGNWCHNNENDAILDAIRDYYRRRDATALRVALTKARHNAHVDLVAFDPDPLRQGTMPAHCPKHTDGAAYPSHMWTNGLLAAYLLSGETDYRDAALSVGKNMLRWQRDWPKIFYCDSRECGWPMLAFVRLAEFTGERRWLAAARAVFEFYQKKVNAAGEIVYDLPHGMGVFQGGYGEFIAWRACFAYYEVTHEADVREFLIRALSQVYRVTYARVHAGGWACNDLFPAWAAYQLTGDDHFITDNYEIVHYLLTRQPGLPWGGVDVMYFFHELHRRGVLAQLASPAWTP